MPVSRIHLSGWTLVFVLLLLVEMAVVGFIGVKTYSQYSDINSASDDVSWAIYQLSLEHQRLLHSTYDGSSNDEIMLRLQIYASRIKILKDDRHLKDLRTGPLRDRLASFFHHLAPIMSTAVSNKALSPNDIKLIRFETEEHASLVRSVAQELVQQDRNDRIENRLKLSRFLLQLAASLAGLIATFTITVVMLWRASQRLGRVAAQHKVMLNDLHSCLLHLPDAILSIDNFRRIRPVNEHAREILLNSESAALQLSTALDAALDMGQRTPSIADINSFAIGDRVFDLHVFQMGGSANNLGLGTVFSLRDVTLSERAREREEALQKALTDASRLNVLGMMAASLGHEIGQPLAAASNFIYVAEELLREGKPTEQVAFHISKAKAMTERMTQVTQQVRSLLPLRADAIVRVDLNDIAYNAIDIIEGATPDISVRLSRSHSDAIVEADPVKLTQIAINLIKNAVQQSKLSKTVQPIDVIVDPGDSVHKISIFDRAGGVRPEQADLIFKPLYSRKLSGAGLGLAIARHLAEEHGGSLTFMNNLEGGATFTISLPAAHEEKLLTTQ